jgi:hypothetical protein
MEILRDEEASSYLARTYGVQRKAKTLRKLRVLGGGPRFQVFGGRFSGYPRSELDKWVEGKLGVVSSTRVKSSSAAARRNRRRLLRR